MSNAAPEIDLNGEKLRDFGNSTPFLPFGKARYTAQLIGLVYHKGHKGRAFRAKFLILSSNRDDVDAGDERAHPFKFTEDAVKQELIWKSLRQLNAAAFKADPSSKTFDGNKAQAALIEATQHDMIKEMNIRVEIVADEVQAKNKDTKELIFNKDGSPKMFTNFYFNAIKDAA